MGLLDRGKITYRHWYSDGRRDAANSYDASTFDFDAMVKDYLASKEADSAKALRAAAVKGFDVFWNEDVEEKGFKVWKIQVEDALNDSIDDGLDPQKCFAEWKAGFKEATVALLEHEIVEANEDDGDDDDDESEEDDDEEDDEDEDDEEDEDEDE